MLDAKELFKKIFGDGRFENIFGDVLFSVCVCVWVSVWWVGR